ncbi:MAG: band 7 protein [Fibrobacteres bacterium]|nr:band 7 protein [Fibrobacterota bacterium]
MDSLYLLGGAVVLVIILFITSVGMFSRFKRCPSDRILVIYGKVGKDRAGVTQTARCIHGGAAFIWPIIQDFQFLSLTPIQIEVDLKNALSKQNIRVNVPSKFTVGISTEPDVMQNAAERLLGQSVDHIQTLAEDIILGQLRLTIATMDIEEINSDRDKFYTNISNNVGEEIKKLGLKLINTNITDINDSAGYIEALGKEAAAKAINDAKKTVAEKNRDGEIGKANAEKMQYIGLAEASKEKEIGLAGAKRDQEISVAEAQQMTRVKVAAANALAVTGENESKVAIAISDAERRQRAAEAEKLATASEQVQKANADKEAYAAQREAEVVRGERDRATAQANVIVQAEIEKRKMEIDAEARAEQTRRLAQGEADGILAMKKAEALGMYEILSKQAEGFQKMIDAAAGDPAKAVQLMIVDKLPQLVALQVEAIKNIKIDEVIVWDNGGGNGTGSSTANFLQSMAGSLPPLQNLFKMAGMDLPEWLAKAHETKTIIVPVDGHDPKHPA